MATNRSQGARDAAPSKVKKPGPQDKDLMKSITNLIGEGMTGVKGKGFGGLGLGIGLLTSAVGALADAAEKSGIKVDRPGSSNFGGGFSDLASVESGETGVPQNPMAQMRTQPIIRNPAGNRPRDQTDNSKVPDDTPEIREALQPMPTEDLGAAPNTRVSKFVGDFGVTGGNDRQGFSNVYDSEGKSLSYADISSMMGPDGKTSKDGKFEFIKSGDENWRVYEIQKGGGETAQQEKPPSATAAAQEAANQFPFAVMPQFDLLAGENDRHSTNFPTVMTDAFDNLWKFFEGQLTTEDATKKATKGNEAFDKFQTGG